MHLTQHKGEHCLSSQQQGEGEVTKELMCCSVTNKEFLPFVICHFSGAVEAEAWMALLLKKECILPELGTTMPCYDLERRTM